MSPHIHTVTTASGATAVQIAYFHRGGTPDLDRVGSAHTAGELAALKAEARCRIQGNQLVLSPELDRLRFGNQPQEHSCHSEQASYLDRPGLATEPG